MEWVNFPEETIIKDADLMGVKIMKTTRKSKSTFSGREIPPGTSIVRLMPGRYASLTILEFIGLLYELTGDTFLNKEAEKLYYAQKI